MLPITLYSHIYGPNPWKVAIILEELSIPYETKFIDFADVKKPHYTDLNPNGRLPTVKDPNTDLVLWESGAIIEYLLDQYDLEYKIHYRTPPDLYHTKMWLHFQVSGQGPYYGQASWFTRSHPENVPSAAERYRGEVRRVTGVLEEALRRREEEGGKWLVGEKCTYADLCFVPWQMWAGVFGGEDLDEVFPRVARWMGEMKMRPAVEKVLGDQRVALGA